MFDTTLLAALICFGAAAGAAWFAFEDWDERRRQKRQPKDVTPFMHWMGRKWKF